MTIGFVDLVLTVLLYRNGLIVELNPLMRPLIEQSEFLFAVVKSATLLVTWAFMCAYAKTHHSFVRKASMVGSAAYLVLWVSWFSAAH
jgi:hypothetical protein